LPLLFVVDLHIAKICYWQLGAPFALHQLDGAALEQKSI
jgi:hypothetical protein